MTFPISITRFAAWSSPLHNAFARDSVVDDFFALGPGERALLEALNRHDVRFLTAHGLRPFDIEYRDALEHSIDGIPVHVLPLERVIASKRATGRPKDLAALPALEATAVARRHDDGS